MSRNWPASENPPRHWRGNARELHQDRLRRPIGSLTVSDTGSDSDGSWKHVVDFAERQVMAEGIERFIRFNPTRKDGR